MDVATVRMLEDIPPQLTAQGWRFVRRDSREHRTLAATWYIAVYERRFEPGTDDERFARPTRDGVIRVSTNPYRSPSWVDAYNDAVQRMEFIDSRRKAGERREGE